MARPPTSDDYGLVINTTEMTDHEPASGGSCVRSLSLAAHRAGRLRPHTHRPDAVSGALAVLRGGALSRRTARSWRRSTSSPRSTQSKMFRNGVRCSRLPRRRTAWSCLEEDNELCHQVPPRGHLRRLRASFPRGADRGMKENPATVIGVRRSAICLEQPYMVIDYRADHSIRVPRPDLTLEIGIAQRVLP